MGEKEEKGVEKQKKGDGEKKEGEGEKKKEGGGKKDEGPPEVVLKVDMHCEGCAKKIKHSLKRLEGVEGVKADTAANKLTVLGKADPWKLKEKVEMKIRRKVDIISPANPPKKEAAAVGDAKKPAAGDAKKSEDTKPKAPVASTVVLHVRLHCEGCMTRIRRTTKKIKGVENVSFDAPKDLVIVKGTMDAKSLPAILKEKLRRSVDIVQPKKDDGGGGGGGEKKEKGGDGGGGEKKEKGGDGAGGEKKEKGGDGGGGEKKEKGGDGGGDGKKEKGDGGEKKDDGEKAALPPAALMAGAPVYEDRMYYNAPYGYRMEMAHAPQMFSDENPNACSIM